MSLGLSNLSRMGLAGVAEFGMGVLNGLLLDTVFPSATDPATPTMEIIEVAGQAALGGMMMGISANFIVNKLNPGNDTGGGMYYLGFFVSQPNMQLKMKRMVTQFKIGLLSVLDPSLGAFASAAKSGSG